MKESSQNFGLPFGGAARLVFIRMQPPESLSRTLLLCTNLPLMIDVRQGQQIGVWMRKLDMLAPMALATLVKEVQDHHHEVGFVMGTIFM